MDIQIDTGPPRYRRRSSGFGRTAIQLLMYFAGLIPMIIIAWKFDAAGLLRGQQQEQVIQVAPPRPAPRIVAPRPAVPTPEQRQPRTIPVENRRERIARSVPPPPIEAEEAEEKTEEPAPEIQEHTFRLLLNEKILRVELPPATAWKVTRVGHYSFRSSNFTGILPCVIAVEGGPRTIFLDMAIDGERLTIKPIVKTDNNHDAIFTIGNLNVILGRLDRAARNKLLRMESSRDAFNKFLAAPGKKVPEAVVNANRKLKILRYEMAEESSRIASLQKEYAAAEKLLAFANELHGYCEITVEEFPEQ